MNLIDRFERAHSAVVSTLRLWVVFLACAGAAAALIAVLQRADVALSGPPAPIAPAGAIAA